MSPRVLVLTVTYASTEALPAFLDSLTTAGGSVAAVVVVENASPDAVETRSLAEAAGARFVDAGANRGYGGGVAAGLATVGDEIDYDYLLVVNPDVTFTPGSLDRLVAAAGETPEGGSFGPRILTAEGDVYPSARKLPSLRTGVAHGLFGRIWPSNPWTVSYRAEGQTDRRRSAGWLSGACVLIRRTAYEQIGGFDLGYFMYFEDVDLGDRLGRAGWSNVYVPDAVITHTGAHSASRDVKRMERAHHDSAYRYLSRRYSAWYFAPLRLALRLGLWGRLWWISR
ncbi:glycosyltransferase family 2 protein [Leifsonia sp. 22587]|uniref:glycosyltransferase family 2 protein n=1 Tax=Leifsonia sp. 22587 TaxID=3453946 RepID=UPI003F87904C